jgi:hypothetical protein
VHVRQAPTSLQCPHAHVCDAGPGVSAVQPVSYAVVPGDLTAQIMGGFTAAGTMAFSLANILLPEVHKTLQTLQYLPAVL